MCLCLFVYIFVYDVFFPPSVYAHRMGNGNISAGFWDNFFVLENLFVFSLCATKMTVVSSKLCRGNWPNLNEPNKLDLNLFVR